MPTAFNDLEDVIKKEGASAFSIKELSVSYTNSYITGVELTHILKINGANKEHKASHLTESFVGAVEKQTVYLSEDDNISRIVIREKGLITHLTIFVGDRKILDVGSSEGTESELHWNGRFVGFKGTYEPFLHTLGVLYATEASWKRITLQGKVMDSLDNKLLSDVKISLLEGKAADKEGVYVAHGISKTNGEFSISAQIDSNSEYHLFSEKQKYTYNRRSNKCLYLLINLS